MTQQAPVTRQLTSQPTTTTAAPSGQNLDCLPRVAPLTPKASLTRALGDLFAGFTLPCRALRLIRRDRALLKKTMRMSLVALVSLTALFIALIFGADALIETLWPTPERWYAAAAHTLLKVTIFAALFFVGANILPPLLLVPLTDPLSIAVERALGLTPPGDESLTRMVRETWRGLANMATRVVVFLFGHALLLPLHFIPGVGGLVWSACASTWSAFWIALSNLDIPMARHLYSFEHAFALLRRRKCLLFGFGAAIALIQWLPILNAAFVPLAIVSATLLLRGLVAAGDLPCPSRPAEARDDPEVTPD